MLLNLVQVILLLMLAGGFLMVVCLMRPQWENFLYSKVILPLLLVGFLLTFVGVGFTTFKPSKGQSCNTSPPLLKQQL